MHSPATAFTKVYWDRFLVGHFEINVTETHFQLYFRALNAKKIRLRDLKPYAASGFG